MSVHHRWSLPPVRSRCGLSAGDSLSRENYRRVTHGMIFEAEKWDAVFGGKSLIADFELKLEPAALTELLSAAEQLAAELELTERALLLEPTLWPKLGLGPALLKALNTQAPWTPAAARCLRFDFHPTDEGWKLSEVNSDVPGGYGEASCLPKLFAEARGEPFSNLLDPCDALATALAAHCSSGNPAVLIADPQFSEDLQVLAIIGKALSKRGIPALSAGPEAVRWEQGHAVVRTASQRDVPASFVFRFFQAEWLPSLKGAGWAQYLRGGKTPVCNPGVASLSESKRFPLVAAELNLRTPAWNHYAALSHEPWAVLTQPRKRLVWKRAYSNTGDHCTSRAWSTRLDTFRAATAALLKPRSYVVQEWFRTQEIRGGVPCVGVHVINGKACGLYCRLGFQGLVNSTALDISYSCK